MVSQFIQNFPCIRASMLHSMEGKFYVGSLEVHKPSPNPNPSPSPNHVPCWEGWGGGDIKFPLPSYRGEILCPPHKISPPWEGKGCVTTHIKFPLHGRSKMSFCVTVSYANGKSWAGIRGSEGDSFHSELSCVHCVMYSVYAPSDTGTWGELTLCNIHTIYTQNIQQCTEIHKTNKTTTSMQLHQYTTSFHPSRVQHSHST